MTDVSKAVRVLWTLPFLIAGWTAGTVVKAVRLARAAVIEGYRLGVTL